MDVGKYLVKKKDAEALEIEKLLNAAGDKIRRASAMKSVVRSAATGRFISRKENSKSAVHAK